MPKKSKWQAEHAGCQAAVDNVAADLKAEIERLNEENARLRQQEPMDEADEDLVAALQEIIWKIDHEQPLGNGHALREIARIALERAARNTEGER